MTIRHAPVPTPEPLDRFDPAGIPSPDPPGTGALSPGSHAGAKLPGVPATAVVASVEAVAAEGLDDWLIWGCVGERPILFSVQPAIAVEMLRALSLEGSASAIIDQSQIVLEPLD